MRETYMETRFQMLAETIANQKSFLEMNLLSFSLSDIFGTSAIDGQQMHGNRIPDACGGNNKSKNVFGTDGQNMDGK